MTVTSARPESCRVDVGCRGVLLPMSSPAKRETPSRIRAESTVGEYSLACQFTNGSSAKRSGPFTRGQLFCKADWQAVREADSPYPPARNPHGILCEVYGHVGFR